MSKPSSPCSEIRKPVVACPRSFHELEVQVFVCSHGLLPLLRNFFCPAEEEKNRETKALLETRSKFEDRLKKIRSEYA